MEARRPLVASKLNRRHKPDYILVLLTVLLMTFGLVTVYAISPGLSAQNNVSENYYVVKQVIAIALGIGAFLITSNLPIATWQKLEKPMIITAFAASFIVRVFGEQVNGAYRWIQVGGLSFQVAELIKFVLIIWLAGFLTARFKNGELENTQLTLRPILIALGCIAVVVAFLQSDLGSTGVMVMITAAMVFVIGMPLKKIAIIGGIIAIGTIMLISTSAYRRDRLATFMNPTRDCQNTGYQACQALIAVGSGGFIGLGLGQGVQAYGYLPEAQNDSIFAIYAEKFGFVGVCVLLGLLLALFARIKNIINRTADTYSRLILVGILAWLSTQAFINIGAMIGLLPLKGITLPFISYGGTSLIFITGAIGLVFQISRYTSYSPVTEEILNGSKNEEDPTSRRRFRGAYNSSTSGR